MCLAMFFLPIGPSILAVECLNPCIFVDFSGPHPDDASMFTQCKTVATHKTWVWL